MFRAEGIPPGDYFLGSPAVSNVRFFSRDGSLNAAMQIHLRVGEDIGCGAEGPLQLHAPAITSLHIIAGGVTGNVSAELGDRLWVSLVDRNPNRADEYVAFATLNKEPQFRIENVPKWALPAQTSQWIWAGTTGMVGSISAAHSPARNAAES